jgi:hypothetical protein
VRPPEGAPEVKDTEIGEIQYHRVDLLPNWFLAERSTLEVVPWDETLKLNEHLEFFARLTAARADTKGALAEGAPTERGRRWRDRWKRLSRGKPLVEAAENGRVTIQAKTTFRNERELSHVGGMARKGDRVEVGPDYAEALVSKDLAARMDETHDTRPFPLPEDTDGADLGCALTPDTTATHLRDEGRVSEDYNEKRFRRDRFMPLQKAKLGISERDLVQWGKYPYESPDFTESDPQILELPEL